MKWIKGIMVTLVLLGAMACNEDVEPYDAEAQLQIDGAKIDHHLSTKGLQAQKSQSGIRYIITTEGTGELPKQGERVKVNYKLYRFSGELLDTNIESLAKDKNIYNPQRDYKPLEFQLGYADIIPGFQLSTYLLKEGGEGDFYIPSVLAYRNAGAGKIYPNENLNFKIELIEIN
ncbi:MULTISPECIES: FKBP-type peptidyl-prolyl cis-trans isomerase [Roseivirga]|jgi:FKBP-type peptidyl-prolyl cis-trans isomerase|uniref:FKBP-type peptidyl-prolyl cis-trans isomerase n=1 Tax=Roseivirga TaxID=290180 RepID=UPI0025804332|nr:MULTISPECIES: FKBP-type peptidyl-prolyl cis-trans isomerase [Roseivirga]|tara:strand:- start:65131 stop:65652 length:522 start_codon:yes stop_codon:yes gene_type:complete